MSDGAVSAKDYVVHRIPLHLIDTQEETEASTTLEIVLMGIRDRERTDPHLCAAQWDQKHYSTMKRYLKLLSRLKKCVFTPNPLVKVLTGRDKNLEEDDVDWVDVSDTDAKKFQYTVYTSRCHQWGTSPQTASDAAKHVEEAIPIAQPIIAEFQALSLNRTLIESHRLAMLQGQNQGTHCKNFRFDFNKVNVHLDGLPEFMLDNLKKARDPYSTDYKGEPKINLMNPLEGAFYLNPELALQTSTLDIAGSSGSSVTDPLLDQERNRQNEKDREDRITANQAKDRQETIDSQNAQDRATKLARDLKEEKQRDELHEIHMSNARMTAAALSGPTTGNGQKKAQKVKVVDVRKRKSPDQVVLKKDMQIMLNKKTHYPGEPTLEGHKEVDDYRVQLDSYDADTKNWRVWFFPTQISGKGFIFTEVDLVTDRGLWDSKQGKPSRLETAYFSSTQLTDALQTSRCDSMTQTQYFESLKC